MSTIVISGASSGFGGRPRALADAGHTVYSGIRDLTGGRLSVQLRQPRRHPALPGAVLSAKAGMDALAQSYALELSRFGIETSIVVPGAFTQGTNHFLHSGRPADQDVAAAYDQRYPGLAEQIGTRPRGVGAPDRGPDRGGPRDRPASPGS
jgi:NAD(P)-dependent dehydrogenase (short-subunit alcohol dehydrogenase family)